MIHKRLRTVVYRKAVTRPTGMIPLMIQRVCVVERNFLALPRCLNATHALPVDESRSHRRRSSLVPKPLSLENHERIVRNIVVQPDQYLAHARDLR